eukprot:scaffold1762_cov128-Cylindrotheca_fusiformis.AAC.3
MGLGGKGGSSRQGGRVHRTKRTERKNPPRMGPGMNVGIPEVPVSAPQVGQEGAKERSARHREEKPTQSIQTGRRTRQHERDAFVPQMSGKRSIIRLGSLGGQQRSIDPFVREPSLKGWNPRSVDVRRVQSRRQWGQRMALERGTGQVNERKCRIRQSQKNSHRWERLQKRGSRATSRRKWSPKRNIPSREKLARGKSPNAKAGRAEAGANSNGRQRSSDRKESVFRHKGDRRGWFPGREVALVVHNGREGSRDTGRKRGRNQVSEEKQTCEVSNATDCGMGNSKG